MFAAPLIAFGLDFELVLVEDQSIIQQSVLMSDPSQKQVLGGRTVTDAEFPQCLDNFQVRFGLFGVLKCGFGGGYNPLGLFGKVVERLECNHKNCHSHS